MAYKGFKGIGPNKYGSPLKQQEKEKGNKSPLKKGESCPAPGAAPTSRTGRKKKRDWKSCKTFGQKVAHVVKQIPKVVVPAVVGYALVKGLKKKK